MRVAIVTGIWKRPEVFKMFAEGIKLLQNHFAGRLEIIVCVAGSEGMHSRKIVANYPGFYYVEIANKPLGVKMNSAVHLARNYKPDYCIMVGSDDLIGVNLMEKYYSLMQHGIDYAYLMDCYFFDTSSKRGLYWGGYTKSFNKGKPAGIGRLISCKVLDLIKWDCWPTGYDRILDTGFDKLMERINCSKQAIWLKKEKLFALDIKSSTNMTPFDKWDNSFYVDGERLLFDNLPETLATIIYGRHGK